MDTGDAFTNKPLPHAAAGRYSWRSRVGLGPARKSNGPINQREMPVTQRTEPQPPDLSRRRFLAGSLACGVAPAFVPARLLGDDAPSKKITLGFIGTGSQGIGRNLGSFLNESAARALAVCDVFADRRAEAKRRVDQRYGNSDCRSYADFRQLLADTRLDAVVISTPDHWHVPMAMMALDAGLDVFCEKPTLTIDEGRRLVDEVQRRNAVFQWGIEDRSVIHYYKLAQWARNGEIGQLQRVEVGLPSGSVWPAEDPAPVPDGLDYDMWVGPAPFHPYTPTRTEAMHWREIYDYSGGMITDWGAHLVDTARLGAGIEDQHPVEVEGEGRIPENAMSNVPVEFDIRYRYADGLEIRVRSGGPSIRFIGTDGWVGNEGWRGRLQASSEKILHTDYDPAESALGPRPELEHPNFLNCVKSRRPTTYTAAIGHRMFTTLHLGHIAVRLGRRLRWDPQRERFLDDDQANALRNRERREDWGA